MPLRPAEFFWTKLGLRNAQAISVVSTAYQGGRVALGAVAPTVVRALGTEEELRGAEHSRARLKRAAERVLESISPIDDLRASAAYRRAMAVSLTEAELCRLLLK
jgi:CO/xanthine dehydrogenase FAD-binding subunit